jgi:hypothetical protein
VIRDFEVEIGDHGKVPVALDEIADRDGGHGFSPAPARA